MNEDQYRTFVAHQRSLGSAYVGVALDKLCRDFGMDPAEVWRLPRQREEQDRRFRRDLLVYRLSSRFAILEPSAAVVLAVNPA